MIRIKIIVEGPTEESFVNNVLAPALWAKEIYATPLILGVQGHKGGNVNYSRVRKDILLQLKQDQSAYCSTMFDLYGLGEGFPGTPIREYIDGTLRATRIEQQMLADIVAAVPHLRPDLRFIPYIQVHEFEGLLFSNPAAFAQALGKENLSAQFQRIRDQFPSPEHINDDPQTAPSKRVIGLYPQYKKVIEGTVAANAIGIENIRNQCPHFQSWLNSIESLTELQWMRPHAAPSA